MITFQQLRLLSITILILLVFTPIPSQAQHASDDILGVWYTKDNKSKISIFECGGDKYCGKIIWMKDLLNEQGEPQKDTENPDEAKRDRTITGLTILTGLKYTGENDWEDGVIYDPESGNTYDCYIEQEEQNRLKIRGYMGFSMLGRSQYWTRHPVSVQ